MCKRFGLSVSLVRLSVVNVMEELVNLVVKETGISQDDARRAVQVVLDKLKSKLPGPIASRFDAFIRGEMSGSTSLIVEEASAMLKGKLGGLFEGK
jgi:hypothetical protein